MRKSRLPHRLALATFLVAVGAIAFATAGFGRSAPTPANPGGRVVLTMGGKQIASFEELSRFTLQTQRPGSYNFADKRQVVNKIPAGLIPPQIVLKRGQDSNFDLWKWHEAVRKGDLSSARRDVTLTAVNSDGRTIAKYRLERAWPMKLNITAMKAGSSEVMYEVTLLAEYVRHVAP